MLASTAYSFFLNLVVLESHVPTTTTPEKATSSGGDDEKKDALSSLIPFRIPAGKEAGASENEKKNSMFSLDKSLTHLSSEFSKSMIKTAVAVAKTGEAMSKTGHSVGQKAATFVANKTAVIRAEKALTKSMDEIVSNHLDMVIGQRFQQGPVIVVQVHLKAAGLPGYIAEVRGEEAAEQYLSAKASLKELGANETIGSLEKEILPVIRQGLMEKMSQKLVSCMKEKDNSLALECIALSESEEAHWLFTFMEFQSQMNK